MKAEDSYAVFSISMNFDSYFFLFQIDFALATFFVVYFFIRFLAADDKLMFIFTIESLVDFFTVPVVFLTGNFLTIFTVLQINSVSKRKIKFLADVNSIVFKKIQLFCEEIGAR